MLPELVRGPWVSPYPQGSPTIAWVRPASKRHEGGRQAQELLCPNPAPREEGV